MKFRKKKRATPLSDSEIVAILANRRKNTISADAAGSDLSDRRKTNLERYLGKPYGDERTGQSSVVTRQCLEAVEWALPSLMRVFASTDKVAEFRPTSKGDVQQAKIESEQLNHTIMVENPGFETMFTFIKSLLMNPTGYIKAYPKEDELSTVEEYENLLPMGLADLMQDPELEPIEQEETECLVEIQGKLTRVPALNIKFRRTQKFKNIVSEAVPPEELHIDANWNKVSLDGCPYICHTTYPTRSELIERGYAKATVDQLPAYTGANAESDEKSERQQHTIGQSHPADSSTDKSTDLIEVEEHYLWIDTDKDGKSEYRMITTSGQYVLENEEIDDHLFIAGCAVPVPHAHVGLAWQELVEDLQKIYTTLTRQFLNNMYRVNNPRPIVGRGINLSDVINDIPGSPIRAKNVDQIRLEPTQSVAQNIAPAFQMLDQAKEARTGTSKSSMGLDADTLSRVANGAFYASLDQANQRLEMLARIIAEFSIKPWFLKVHKLMRSNYTSPKEMEVSGQWMTISPSEWKARKTMKMLVGLGTGNKQAQAAAVEKIIEKQAELVKAGSPMVSPQNLYNSLTKLVTLAEGMPSPDTYFTDPEKYNIQSIIPQGQGQGQGGNDVAMKLQLELAKVERQKAQLKYQTDMAEMKRKTQDDIRKYQQQIAELRAKLAETGRKLDQGDRKLDIDEFKATTGAEIEAAKIMQEDDRLEQQMDTWEDHLDY